jgi:hypothetical protein
MDGELRKIFRQNLPKAQWTAVETGLTAQGVPDAEYVFPGGDQGWVECKRSSAWAVSVRPLQVAWVLRRVRLGGRCFVAVRRRDDELWLLWGSQIKSLAAEGLRGATALGVWTGGPSKWYWDEIERLLRGYHV